jgi:hypothetical protein
VGKEEKRRKEQRADSHAVMLHMCTYLCRVRRVVRGALVRCAAAKIGKIC